MRRLLPTAVVVFLAGLLGGCSGYDGYQCPGGQCTPCRDYITCYEHTGGTKGSLDSHYGTSGTCFTTTPAAARNCFNLCLALTAALKRDYPDAGC